MTVGSLSGAVTKSTHLLPFPPFTLLECMPILHALELLSIFAGSPSKNARVLPFKLEAESQISAACVYICEAYSYNPVTKLVENRKRTYEKIS